MITFDLVPGVFNLRFKAHHNSFTANVEENMNDELIFIAVRSMVAMINTEMTP